MLAVRQVADCFRAQAKEEWGQRQGHPKLQKLCCCEQGFHLAFRREPLFREQLRAWAKGPVVRELRDDHRHARGPLPALEDYDAGALEPEKRRFLDIVLERFVEYSGAELSRFTHKEALWQGAYERLKHGKDDVITHESLGLWLAELDTDEAQPPPSEEQVRQVPTNAQGSGK